MQIKRFSVESKIAILEKNIPVALAMLKDCTVCPRLCHVDRTNDELGKCGVPAKLKVSSANLHFGEEPPISGKRGSGTIFLSGCNLRCIYCQNYPISQYRHGEFYSVEQVAAMMLALEEKNAHNINFVTPTHFVPLLMKAMLYAYKSGLTLPIVYNSSGYDSIDMLTLLDGVIDVYMPDMRYADPKNGLKYSGVPDYPEVNRAVIKEMHRQVGILQVNDGIASRGLLIRHLVLPERISGSKKIFNFIAREISSETYVSVMSQYFPAYNAYSYPHLSRRLTKPEYDEVLIDFERAGLSNGYIQPYLA